jgi:hypothetical protein
MLIVWMGLAGVLGLGAPAPPGNGRMEDFFVDSRL